MAGQFARRIALRPYPPLDVLQLGYLGIGVHPREQLVKIAAMRRDIGGQPRPGIGKQRVMDERQRRGRALDVGQDRRDHAGS